MTSGVAIGSGRTNINPDPAGGPGFPRQPGLGFEHPLLTQLPGHVATNSWRSKASKKIETNELRRFYGEAKYIILLAIKKYFI